MNKKIIIILSIVIIAILVGIFVYMNWNTIGAVIDGVQYSTEEVESQLEQTQKELQDYIDKNEHVDVRDLTQEEKDALNKGEITDKEAIKIMTGKTTLQTIGEDKKNQQDKPPAEQQQPENNDDTVQKPQEPTKQPEAEDEQKVAGDRVSELIATLYITKNSYLSQLDTLEANLGAEFEKLTLENKRAEKPKIIAKYTPIIGAWERECDAAVYAVIDQIEAELKKSGQDLSIVDKIKQTYKDEKRARKAYYVSEYM